MEVIMATQLAGRKFRGHYRCNITRPAGQAAEKLYLRIMQLDPNDVNALHLVGVLYQQKGKNALAVDYISQAARGRHLPAVIR
jgi:hypothetical protein